MSNFAKRLFNPGPQSSGVRTGVIWTGLAAGSAFVIALIFFSFRTPDPPPTSNATAAPRLPALSDMVSTETATPAPRAAPSVLRPSATPPADPPADPPAQPVYQAPGAPAATIATSDPPPTLSPAQAETKAAAQADSVWFVASPPPSGTLRSATASSTTVALGARIETPDPDTLVLRDGSLIPAIMQSSIDSTIPGGYVKAIVSGNVWDGLHNSVVIPTGSWLFGKVSSSQGDNQTRLAIEWSELQYSDGRTLLFDSTEPEVDRTGTNGVGATVDQHMGQVVKRVLLTSVFVGALGAVASNQCSGYGCQASVGTGITQAAAANIASAGADLIRAGILRPTSHVSEGQPIALMIVHGSVSFPVQ